jgi:GNAT superfamily N-acetyltransferase
MFDRDRMLLQEVSFYESFTNKVITDYGVIYYNPLNPQSHDSNHAHILHVDDHADVAIQDIARFYGNHRLTPCVYQSFVENELAVLRPHLESQGFVVHTITNTFMQFHPGKVPPADPEVSVRRLSQVSADIVELIHTEDDGDWTINVLKTHVNDERFHLLGLFRSDKCLSIASVKTMDGYSRVDDVVTHKAFRGRGLGTKLIEYLVRYHATISGNHLYLYADNPIAINLYKRVGFQETAVNKPRWSAEIRSA